ncbi:MAG: hypothetical protein TEF_21415 [Rhizobiales bacterium NRL2]|jgi:signal transduction histidine kinase|nr:MAG: hypothetical protein TEF_21415 [Rhizobiales bacterium NRL2]
METPDAKSAGRRIWWSGEFADPLLENAFKTASYDQFAVQHTILGVIIMLVAGPVLLADYLLYHDWAWAGPFTVFRGFHFLLPGLWVLGCRLRWPRKRIAAIVSLYVLFIVGETLVLILVNDGHYELTVIRMVIFLIAGNILLDIDAHWRLFCNVLLLAIGSVGFLYAFDLPIEIRVVETSLFVASALIGNSAAAWQAGTRRTDFARKLDLEAANAALSEARRRSDEASAAKSVFLANVSHELRTPLNAVIGFSETLRTELFGPLGHSKYKEYVGDIHQSGRHLLMLINDLLDLSRIEAGKLVIEPEWTPLAAEVRDWRAMMRPALEERRQTLEIDPGWDAFEIWIDRRSLHQMIVNLLTNASKYAPTGTTIRLGFDQNGHRETVLSVCDEGPGMSPDQLERILRPFEQADSRTARDTDGWGLGLPLTNALAEANGCALQIDSRPGEGTAARLRIPADRVRPRTGAGDAFGVPLASEAGASDGGVTAL